MTLTRLPSGRRASASGVVWSTRRPTLLHDALRDLEQMLLVAELDRRELELALLFDEGLLGAVDHDVGDVRIGQQLLERAVAEQLVDQHLFQRELLAAVEVDLQLGEHFADDRAEFLGELVLGQRRGGFGIDALEQARKHLLLDLVDRGIEAFGLVGCGVARSGLPVGEARHRVTAMRRGFGFAGGRHGLWGRAAPTLRPVHGARHAECRPRPGATNTIPFPECIHFDGRSFEVSLDDRA